MSDAERVKELEKELRDLRTNVVTVAQKYAKEHRMCEVVDEALTEAGLLKEPVVKKISATIGVEILAPISGNIDDMSPEEIQEAFSQAKVNLTGELPPGLSVTTSVANGIRKIHQPQYRVLDVQVIEIEDIDEEDLPSQGVSRNSVLSDSYNHYRWGFTSNEGRVAHLFVTLNARGDDWAEFRNALCGAAAHWHKPTDRSPRDEGTNCSRCMARSSHLNYIGEIRNPNQ